MLQPVVAAELLLDLTGDGQPEMIALERFEENGVVFGRFEVTDRSGNVLYRGPRDNPDFLFLGEFDGAALRRPMITRAKLSSWLLIRSPMCGPLGFDSSVGSPVVSS